MTDPTNEPNHNDLEFRVRHVDGEVVIEFNHQIKHFRLDPELALRFSEGVIAATVNAAKYLDDRKSSVVQIGAKPGLILPGLPRAN